MARKRRLEYPDAIYHVINRGDRREAIFLDEADRGASCKLLASLPIGVYSRPFAVTSGADR